ncbi:hypothetical protein SAMN04488132_104333 [Sediminibacterium ginsengisoli]|uniref:Uncharacterized protein n=2 Tax=Sediminibacterium ginsengisoli TaxID=413434 RepID=A0A1T4NNJ0_9BACT|nr:hypothetical protein SAMN04488132_104333 [Sediminibacterium ginsengisoli]
MEPGVKEYMIRILNTLSVGLLWMAINSTAGIMYDLAFIHDHVRTVNILFYIWFVISLAAYLWYVFRLWRKPIKFDEY